ncbi:hypothetical protein [Helicobacter felis]|uniref:hypothetical protein n=1 Tax=Helicobacter felis TaxID=214 RepID=UPI000CF047B7|nr:hypothetical protein [Helicobacter felis]
MKTNILISKFNPVSNYTAIPNELFSLGLSAGAFHVVAYINSRPSNWHLSTEELCAVLNKSSNTIHKYLQELKTKGVLDVVFVRSKEGFFTGVKHWVLKLPEPQNYPITQKFRNAKIGVRRQVPKIGHSKKASPHASGVVSITQNLRPCIIKNKRNMRKKARAQNFYVMSSLSSVAGLNNAQKKKAFEQALNTHQQPTLEAFKEQREEELTRPEQESFSRFLAHIGQAKRLTCERRRALYAKALEIKAEGHDLCACIQKSIENGYNTILPPLPPKTPSSSGFLRHILAKHREIDERSAQQAITTSLDITSALISKYEGLTLENIKDYIFEAFERSERA